VVHLRSVLRFASGFFPTRPHGASSAVSRRHPLRAVASGSRLLPTRPAKDFHLQSSAHVRHTFQDCLRHALRQAGAASLMTPELIATICDHAQGNPRALMIMADELLAAAAQREARQIDETLFFEICAVPTANETKAAIRRRR
jgi:hypothetical protein